MGNWAVGRARSTRERSEVAKLTGKMKPVCVGRFLVDVPTQLLARLQARGKGEPAPASGSSPRSAPPTRSARQLTAH